MFKGLAGLSNARRRHATSKPAKTGGNNDLYEPLIPLDGPSTADEHDDSFPSTSATPPPPADWNYLFNLVTSICGETFNCLYNAVATCFGLWGPAPLPPLRLTDRQQQRLSDLKGRLAVQYDPSNKQHEAQLQQLWQLAFPNEPFVGPKGDRWKDMGWQNEDPSSDFRGGGLLALQALVFMGQQHPRTFALLRYKQQGHRSDWEYPFGAAAVNLLFTLSQLLDLRNPQGPPTTTPGRHFCALLEDSDQAFEELFVAAFQLLDHIWLDTKASYMQFPLVIKDTQQRVVQALSNRPATVAELHQMLQP